MATIRSFRALRYSPLAGPLDDVLAPPYDVLSGEERETYAAQSPHNVVHLTLPATYTDDRSKFVRYARSAALLEEWRRMGFLEVESKPSLYRLTQEFDVPNLGARVERVALVALIKVEAYEKGVVLPHEQTFPKHKEDRLRILEATGSHLECIFGLYDDPTAAVHRELVAAPAQEVADATTRSDGIRQRLARIDDLEAVRSLEAALTPLRVWIADGHHRYETALAFRAQRPASDEPIPEDFMMMALCSLGDPGLVLLPTHRILKWMPVDGTELRARLSDGFAIEDLANSAIPGRLSTASAGTFGVALPGGAGFLATVKDVRALTAGHEGSERLAQLDVSILHDQIFAERLGLKGLDFFGYTRLDGEALEAVETGAPASFLMRPPSVEDMCAVALGGEKMPQKSTYYYPKLPSGLTMWSLKDF